MRLMLLMVLLAPPAIAQMPNRLALTYQSAWTLSSVTPGSPASFNTTYQYANDGGRTLSGSYEGECFMDWSVGWNPFIISPGNSLTLVATRAKSNPCGTPFNSGMITTEGIFSQQYGYFEILAKLPAAPSFTPGSRSGYGLWPGFWLMGQNTPYVGEIDILENIGNPTMIHAGSDGCCDASGNWNNVQSWMPELPFDASAGFHRYGVDWEPGSITIFVDGVAQASWPTHASLQGIEMYPIVDFAMGGAGRWPGLPASNTVWPQHMVISYLKVWATAGTVSVNGKPFVVPPAAPRN